MSSLNELRVACCFLSLAAVAASVVQSPALPPLAVVPWVIALGLLASRRGPAIQVALSALVSTPASRLAIVAMAAVGLLLLALTNAGFTVIILGWGGAVGMLAAAVLGPSQFREGFINATLAIVVFTGLSGLVEAGLRLPSLASRFGTPQDRARWEQAYDHLERRNLFHLRSRHETLVRATGTRRILAIGDSFTWGDKILTTDSVWPGLLENELSHASPMLPTEVINLSKRGWNTMQEAAALDRLGWQFSPDRVIVQFYANDTELSRDEETGITAQWRTAWEPLRAAPIERSALLWTLKRTLTGRSHGNVYRTFLERASEDSPGWHQMRRALHRMADSARVRGVPIMLVLFPDFVPGTWTPATYPLAPIYRKVAEEARADGFDVLDLTPVYADQGGNWKRWWATAFDSHPSAGAHLVAARAIARHLIGLNWPSSTDAVSRSPIDSIMSP